VPARMTSGRRSLRRDMNATEDLTAEPHDCAQNNNQQKRVPGDASHKNR
jgi:hypothetical protein